MVNILAVGGNACTQKQAINHRVFKGTPQRLAENDRVYRRELRKRVIEREDLRWADERKVPARVG